MECITHEWFDVSSVKYMLLETCNVKLDVTPKYMKLVRIAHNFNLDHKVEWTINNQSQ